MKNYTIILISAGLVMLNSCRNDIIKIETDDIKVVNNRLNFASEF